MTSTVLKRVCLKKALSRAWIIWQVKIRDIFRLIRTPVYRCRFVKNCHINGLKCRKEYKISCITQADCDVTEFWKCLADVSKFCPRVLFSLHRGTDQHHLQPNGFVMGSWFKRNLKHLNPAYFMFFFKLTCNSYNSYNTIATSNTNKTYKNYELTYCTITSKFYKARQNEGELTTLLLNLHQTSLARYSLSFLIATTY